MAPTGLAIATLVFAGVILGTVVVFHQLLSQRKSRWIPQVGPPASLLKFQQWKANQDWYCNARHILQEGYDKYGANGKIFQIDSAMPPRILIPRRHFDLLSSMPETILSHRHTVAERFLGYWTGLDVVEQSTLHNEIVAKTLVQNLPALMETMYQEAVSAIDEAISELKDQTADGKINGIENKWQTAKASEFVFTLVSRVNSRILVGPELCRNPEWLALCSSYARDVVALAECLRPFPRCIRPLVYMFSASGKRLRTQTAIASRLLLPLIEQQKRNTDSRMSEKHIRTDNGKPGNILQWIMERKTEVEANPRNIVSIVLFFTMAGFHAPTMQATYTIFDLCLHPDLVRELRDEVYDQLNESGGRWTMKVLQHLWKLDSTLKESQRLHPPALLVFNRVVRQSFTLPDGTYLARGSFLAVPMYQIFQDPRIWPDPQKFQPLRFYKKRMGSTDAKGVDGFRQQFANGDDRIFGFGLGRYTCPGRVFSATLLKMLLGLIIQKFDLQLPVPPDRDLTTTNREPGQQMPETLFFGEATLPDPAALFQYRAINS